MRRGVAAMRSCCVAACAITALAGDDRRTASCQTLVSRPPDRAIRWRPSWPAAATITPEQNGRARWLPARLGGEPPAFFAQSRLVTRRHAPPNMIPAPRPPDKSRLPQGRPSPQPIAKASAPMGGTGVIDRFLEVFTRYIDTGFGLLGGEVAFIATTLIVDRHDAGGLFWAWGADDDIIARLVKKTLFVGVFAYPHRQLEQPRQHRLRELRRPRPEGVRLRSLDRRLPAARPRRPGRPRRRPADPRSRSPA